MSYNNFGKKDKNNLYQQLADLIEAKKIINSAIHNNFYNRQIAEGLYLKLEKVNKKIAEVKIAIKKERSTNEKSGNSV